MTARRCRAHRLRKPAGNAASCLKCQAADARYRAMLRVMREMREENVVAPPHLVDDVMTALDASPESEPSSGRSAAVAIAGGTAVAIAAAAAIAGIRHRRAA